MLAQTTRNGTAIAVLVSAVLLTALTVYVQYSHLGLSYLEGPQIRRHLRVMQVAAPDPWQYRVLPEYLVEEIIRGMKALAVPSAVAVAFLVFRAVQNFLLFVAAHLYYRALGLALGPSLLGLSLLAWGMTNALYDSDLQLSTYFDVAAYLLAGWVIMRNKLIWIIPITAAAALNRETSGLIPIIMVAAHVSNPERKTNLRKVLFIAVVSLAIYAVVFVGLRMLLGPRPPAVVYGHRRGLPILKFNLVRPITYLQVLATLGIIPLMALFMYRRWPRVLRAFFWTLVPIWTVIHMFLGVLAESRLLLVPQALVFIPAALIGFYPVRQPAAGVAGTDMPGPSDG